MILLLPGDRAGLNGERVACACGDAPWSSPTSLKAGDPVITTLCTGVGLRMGPDGITLNCNGYEITGAQIREGVVLSGRYGVTVRSCKITRFTSGIALSASSGNALLANTISGSGVAAIVLQVASDGNLVKSNRVVGPAVDGINLGLAIGNTILTYVLDGAEAERMLSTASQD